MTRILRFLYFLRHEWLYVDFLFLIIEHCPYYNMNIFDSIYPLNGAFIKPWHIHDVKEMNETINEIIIVITISSLRKSAHHYELNFPGGGESCVVSFM